VRLGALVLQTRPWDVLVDDFRRAEQLGYDIAYVADHLTHTTMSGEWLGDGWTTLAAAAITTSKIELGTLVASAAFRSPVTLARSAATVNDVAGGRLVLGLGAGSPYRAAVERAEELGFDEVVVYWPDAEPGGRFWSDVHVHEKAVSELRR
jgi:alkanesulfonate monooxygenase SsuD/methylene tetrahydromethanopterin reductase-like flavin-dependent oxidoreductase (luciferase family)